LRAEIHWTLHLSKIWPCCRKRYQQSADTGEEIPTADKVVLLAKKILTDRRSLPGHVYQRLFKTFVMRRSDLPLGLTDRPSQDEEEDGGSSRRRRRDDAHSIIKIVTANLLEAKPNFAQTAALTFLTTTAVEAFLFDQIYP